MIYQRIGRTVFLATACALLGAAVWADPPPPDTHGDDLLWGRDQNFGISGSGINVWFSDSATNPNHQTAQWLAMPHRMIPNINAPDSDSTISPSQGNIYLNLGSNEVVYYNGQANVGVMSSGTMTQVSVSPGLEIWKSQYRFFAPAGTPTAQSGTFPYPYVGTWHNHFAVRAFRPGTYTFVFKMTNGIASDGTHLTDSPNLTLTVRSQPVLSSAASLPGWARMDNSRNLTGNRARVYVFAADSTPAHESDAIVTTDVYLDNAGNFAVPEALIGLTDGNAYRVGVKPMTAPGIARLYSGNLSLATAAPAAPSAITLPLGDVDGDGQIDDADVNAVVQKLGQTITSTATFGPNVSGSGVVSVNDVNIVVNSLAQVADFTP